MTDKNLQSILKAYEYMERVTPIKEDCGRQCAAKCCKGSDTDGMLLFPGEKKLFENNSNFEVYFEERYGCYAVRCQGFCERKDRPLSCRIFPYFIYSHNEKLTVAPDIRALEFCPLIVKKSKIDRSFLRALRICAKKFAAESEIFEFICKISSILTDFNEL